MNHNTITSMTGFGSGKAEGGETVARVTVRSVNGRFLDIQIRCPSVIQDLESRLKDRVQQVLSRGKVTVQIEVEEAVQGAGEPVIDLVIAHKYLAELRNLAKAEDMVEEITLESIARMPGVFKIETNAAGSEDTAKLVYAALDDALAQCDHMRRTEGEALAGDLRERIAVLKRLQEEVEGRAAVCKVQYLSRLREKVSALLEPGEVNEDRLAMEVVIMAERSDITEEIVRFRSHTDQFSNALITGGDVGKRLNFLLQEMHREANTISSKATETDIIHQVLTAKEEIERMREQVQNLV